MTPDEWEGYCHSLCRLRHGEANYQQVPDRDRGDLGIEGFALDGSCAVYQFYVTDALDTAGRFLAQQRKITRDLGKLKKNDQALLATVGFRIKRWILVVPSYDSKRIVDHATTKAQEVANLGLSCVDPEDFRVLVQDDSAFAIEREKLLSAGVTSAAIQTPEPTGEEVADWTIQNATEILTLDEKLKRMAGLHANSGGDQPALRNELLSFHLAGENYAQVLETDYPELYERFTQIKSREEHDLPARSLTTPMAPREHFAKVREQYETRLASDAPGLAPDDARMLSWAGVADWLIRCPLDFQEPNP